MRTLCFPNIKQQVRFSQPGYFQSKLRALLRLVHRVPVAMYRAPAEQPSLLPHHCPDCTTMEETSPLKIPVCTPLRTGWAPAPWTCTVLRLTIPASPWFALVTRPSFPAAAKQSNRTRTTYGSTPGWEAQVGQNDEFCKIEQVQERLGCGGYSLRPNNDVKRSVNCAVAEWPTRLPELCFTSLCQRRSFIVIRPP